MHVPGHDAAGGQHPETSAQSTAAPAVSRERGGPRRGFFDLWSLVYDAPAVQRLTYRPVQDAVLRALRPAPPASILDIGCGTGRLTRRLSRELPGCRVVGCDFSGGMLRHARARGAASLVQGDAQRLPFASGAFAAVVSTESFHWFPDPRAALADFHRLLVPGGRLLVACVNPRFEALSRFSRAVSLWVGEPLRWPTPETLRRQMEGAGFRVTAQHQVLRVSAPILLPAVLTEAVRA